MRRQKLSLYLCLFQLILVHCQEDCDPIFDDTCTIAPTPKCWTIDEIDAAVFTDTRQAINICESEAQKCEDYSELGFACANVWSCRNNTIITDGKGLIDVRSATPTEKTNQCGVLSGTIDVSAKICPDPDKVCCRRPNFRISKCEDDQTRQPDYEEYDDYDIFDDPSPQVPADEFSQCGRNASGSVLTITGDDGSAGAPETESQPGEFPHMCVIFQQKEGFKDYIGGAALIARNKVITVAHKFYHENGNKRRWLDRRDDFDNIYVRCGEYNVKIPDKFQIAQESAIKEIQIHPDYDPRNVRYNLAILVTEENFVYQEHVGPVCLPQPDKNFEGDTDCWSSGWGREGYESGFYSDTLKKIDMRIVPRDECIDTFRQNNLPASRAHPSFICVGGEEDKDTCEGDGGSPHVCFNEDNQYVLVGAVSHGKGCGTEIPASYANVAGSMCWIDWVMSVIPLSQYDIDDRETPLDLRTIGNEFRSINKLTRDQCGEFKRIHGRTLTNEIGGSVYYEIIDERSST